LARILSRREFVLRAGAAAGTAAALRPATAQDKAPAIATRPGPVVIASANGNKFKNGGERTCVAEAWERMARGEDVLDAIVAGVNIVELDPLDDSVGYGGLPNADGVVQLDASCMHGPKRRAGAVAAIEGVRTPARVAQAVADLTDHHLLVGRDATDFARKLGFTVEDDLNTEHSRALWLEWKRRTDPDHFPDPAERSRASERAIDSMIADGLLHADRIHGTIHCAARSAAGAIAGATTTSGLSFKIPGRVGDSPILGAGLWLDQTVGSAGSTGRGEANLYNLCSFLIVERMRTGDHPKDAALAALRRVQAGTVERRLLNSRGTPRFQLSFYAMNAKGEHAGVALYAGYDPKYAVCDASGPRTVAMEALLPGKPEDEPASPKPAVRP